jgi:hypothetical protein
LTEEAHPFDVPNWSFVMAAAWIADRTQPAVEAAARGYSKIDRRAVELLLKELGAGKLIAWGTIDGKTFPISPQHWRRLEPVFARKRFSPGFAETFGNLVMTLTEDGTNRTLQEIIISSEVQKLFPADRAFPAPASGRIQRQRERAVLALRGLFGDNVPTAAEMNNGILCREVALWLAKNRPLPKGNSEVSRESILRAAGRKR